MPAETFASSARAVSTELTPMTGSIFVTWQTGSTTKAWLGMLEETRASRTDTMERSQKRVLLIGRSNQKSHHSSSRSTSCSSHCNWPLFSRSSRPVVPATHSVPPRSPKLSRFLVCAIVNRGGASSVPSQAGGSTPYFSPRWCRNSASRSCLRRKRARYGGGCN